MMDPSMMDLFESARLASHASGTVFKAPRPHSALSLLAACILSLCLLQSCSSSAALRESSPHLYTAKRAYENRNYALAIDGFKAHIDYRLTQNSRPKWENPYFYLLYIADSYLAMAQPEQSLSAIEQAEAAGVENELIVDRVIKVANFYESRNRDEEALRVLGKYRDRDDLLIDLYRDRLARELVDKERE